MVDPPCGKIAAISRVPPSHLSKARHQIPDPEFAHDASKSGVVDSAMGEEVFVLRGEDRVANNGRDVLIRW